MWASAWGCIAKSRRGCTAYILTVSQRHTQPYRTAWSDCMAHIPFGGMDASEIWMHICHSVWVKALLSHTVPVLYVLRTPPPASRTISKGNVVSRIYAVIANRQRATSEPRRRELPHSVRVPMTVKNDYTTERSDGRMVACIDQGGV